MPNNDDPESQQSNGDDTPPASLADSQIAPSGNNHPQPPGSEHSAAQGDPAPTHKTILWEIRWLDVINALVGVAMLIVAIAAYRVASDTGDIKKAVANISDLATQTKREADNLHDQFGQIKREADAAEAQTQLLKDQLGQVKLQTSAFQSQASAAHGQLREMRQEQRAWIATDWAYIQGAPKVGDVIKGYVQYGNTGHSPAFNLRISQDRRPIPGNATWNSVVTYMKCDVVGARTGNGQIVFPSIEKTIRTYIPVKQTEVYPQTVADRKTTLIWQGCITYMSLGVPHKTRWCYWLRGEQPQTFDQWYWDVCPVGNEAD